MSQPRQCGVTNRCDCRNLYVIFVMSNNGIPRFTSELKFLVDAARAARIADWARARLAPDPHGGGRFSDEYRVSSLYFDTDARDVFHRRGSYGRSKYRIRRYHQEPTVYLERKLRVGTRLAKRRTRIELATLPLVVGERPPDGDGTAWFRRRVAARQLRPVCQVTYLRMARDRNTPDGPARLTLDYLLLAAATDTFSFEPHPATPLLDGEMILELKYRGAVPAVFKQLVEEFRLSPRRSSKYRVAAGALGLAPQLQDSPPDIIHA